MSKTRCLTHIVFATKRREMTITEEHKRELYAYIYGIINNKQCHVHRINGIANHIHLLIDLHPMIALADLIKDIKQFSNKWMKENRDKFPKFDRWGEGYFATSVGVNDLESCKGYIMNQESHHNVHDLLSEMEGMALACGLAWHEEERA